MYVHLKHTPKYFFSGNIKAKQRFSRKWLENHVRQVRQGKYLWGVWTLNWDRNDRTSHLNIRGRTSQCRIPKADVKSALSVHAKSLQSCPTLCNPVAYSPPGSSVHGILQARILEWIAMPFSWGSSWPRDQTQISEVSCTGRQGSLPLAPLGKPQVCLSNQNKDSMTVTEQGGRRKGAG